VSALALKEAALPQWQRNTTLTEGNGCHNDLHLAREEIVLDLQNRLSSVCSEGARWKSHKTIFLPQQH
jgi:hypothetical protein